MTKSGKILEIQSEEPLEIIINKAEKVVLS